MLQMQKMQKFRNNFYLHHSFF